MLDLDRVGFARRIFMARKWYGGDWWFVLFSSILLLFVIIVGFFPQLFAPNEPRAEVGPSLLAPGETPSAYVLVVPGDSGVTSLDQIGTNEDNIGYQLGTDSSQALREALDELNAAAEPGIRYQPRPRRFETLEEGLAALEAGELDGFVAAPADLEGILENYPGWLSWVLRKNLARDS
jgi:ABC-type amino acid transport substrate-binding protein